MATYRVRNWTKFQHYKDRNPPWIKLHVEILSSKDWVMLDDAGKLLAIACMIVAAKDNGNVPDDPSYIQRVAYLQTKPDFKPLIKVGFLEVLADASNLLADARPEKETETETEKDNPPVPPLKGGRVRNDLNGHKDDFQAFYDAYPRHVGRRAAEKAYKAALSRSDAGAILAGAQRYAAAAKGKDAQFVAHPASWLNADRWLDEQAGAATSVPVPVLSPEVLAEERRLLKERGII
jgi:hypothetical protein